MYPNRITASGISYRAYPMHDYSSDHIIEVPVITEKVTIERALRLLVDEGYMVVNFELSRAEFGNLDAMKNPGKLLGVPLAPDLLQGYKFGEPEGEFRVVWVSPSALDDASNVVISAKINLALGLHNLLRGAGVLR